MVEKHEEKPYTHNVLPFSKKLKYNPVHVQVAPEQVQGYLEQMSDCLTEQVLTTDRRVVLGKIGHINEDSELSAGSWT